MGNLIVTALAAIVPWYDQRQVNAREVKAAAGNAATRAVIARARTVSDTVIREYVRAEQEVSRR